MAPEEVVMWMMWLTNRKEATLKDAQHYDRQGDRERRVACEVKATAYDEMMDKLTRSRADSPKP